MSGLGRGVIFSVVMWILIWSQFGVCCLCCVGGLLLKGVKWEVYDRGTFPKIKIAVASPIVGRDFRANFPFKAL